MTSGAVFLSYASEDADAAARICEVLRASGVEVWFDRNELRGGDAWDSQIKKQIQDCALFIPLISAHTNARIEGYFRGEWNLATRRLVNRAHDAAFLMPVVVDETREADARVPEESLRAQWTWLPGGQSPPAFAKRVRQLLGLDAVQTPTKKVAATGAIEPRSRGVGSVRLRGTSLARRFALPLIALLLLAGGGIFWYFQGASEAPASMPAPSAELAVKPVPPNDKSIAVLPFADMSAEKNQEYMSDGIAEELLNLLAQVPDLKVIARTSSFAFKDQNIDIAEIARKLNVAHVLEGSVRTSGDKMRITAQLFRAADSTHLWSERYDRPMDDIFTVQDEIAKSIVQALQIRLKGGTLSRRAGGTQNLEAYELYLRALTATKQNTKASLDAAEDYANRAVKLDPNYGLAWLQLANIVQFKVYGGYLATTEGFERYEQFTQHALRLSPDIAEAHVNLSGLYLVRDFDWAAATVELQRALAIDPTDPTALIQAAWFSTILGKNSDGERQHRAAMERDPLDLGISESLADLYVRTGRLAEAEDIVRSVIDRQPEREWTHSLLAKILLVQGKVEAALAALEHETNEQARMSALPLILHTAGRQTEADEALKELIKSWAVECAECIAKVYAYRGDHDQALEWLERAYRQKDVGIFSIVHNPFYGNLKDDPGFKSFVRKRLKIPVG